MSDTLSLMEDLIRTARKAGADAVDVVAFDGASLSVSVRKGGLERLEREEAGDIGLRVLVGSRAAIVSTSDRRPSALREAAERAVAMARVVPEDPFAGPADSGAPFVATADLELCDPAEPDPDVLTDKARAMEEAALAVPGVANSDGADASWSRTRVSLAVSNGFSGTYDVSRWSLAVAVLAGEGTGMERDHDHDTRVWGGDLRDPEEIGRTAGERTTRRLNSRRIAGGVMPVVFEDRVARSLLGHLTSAISGSAIARGTSFLKDKMDALVLPEGLSVIDDPFRPRGLRSRPFDGEGLLPSRRALVENGVLRTWLLDLRSARKLGLAPTGHGSRGTSGPPSPSSHNVHLTPGDKSPEELIAEITDGILVTDLLGFGVNGVTGDYSRGAAGFRIENGKITHPVSEVTVAGNLVDMFRRMEAANDLKFRFGTDSPTLRVDGMTVAGA